MKLEAGDERILKATNQIASRLYLVILALTLFVVLLKYVFFTQDIMAYVLEGVAVLASLGYLGIRTLYAKVPLLKRSDDAIVEIQNSYRAHSFNICTFTYIVGATVLTFGLNQDYIAVSLYMPIVLIPSSIYTFQVIRKGLFVWGSKKAKRVGLKNFKMRVALGSVFFGVLTQWSEMFKEGVFHPTGLIWVAGMGAFWGLGMYFFIKFLFEKSERYAEKELLNNENKDD